VTAHEAGLIATLTNSVNKLAEEVHVHVALTKEQFAAFRALCDERHGLHPGNLAQLKGDVAKAKGGIAALKTIAPWLLTGLTIALSVLLHYT
jgi:hypothetical protein